MAINLESISKGKAIKAPRIVLIGGPKIGKSTFAGQSPSPIFIPIKGEEGADDLDVAKFPTANAFSDVMECLGCLYQDVHEYQTVVIDSASMLETLVWDETCARNSADGIEKVGGGYGKGYIEASKIWREVMDGLDALRQEKNMTSILIGHVTKKQEEDPSAGVYMTHTFDVHKRASQEIYRWADCVLYAGQPVTIREEDAGFNKSTKRAIAMGDRKLYTQDRPAHPGGGRGIYGRLPYEMPLSWTDFENAVSQAV